MYFREGHDNVVEFLLNKDPSLGYSVKTKNGRTPCHTAALHGHLGVIRLLLSKNKENSDSILNSKDSCGNTPFMEALLADHLEIVKYLLENFKAVNIQDKDNLENSCIHIMAQSGSIQSLRYLFGKYFGIGMETLNLEDVDQICKAKINLIDKFSNTLNTFLMTPLHSACKVLTIVFFVLN